MILKEKEEERLDQIHQTVIKIGWRLLPVKILNWRHSRRLTSQNTINFGNMPRKGRFFYK